MPNEVWSIRVPPYVKEYYQKNKRISGGQALTEKYYDDKKNELPDLLRRLAEAEKDVLQLRQNILQIQSECSTESTICSTIATEFEQQGRDINNPTPEDKYWIQCKLENNNIKTMDMLGFLDHYRGKE